jgi:hypothetical protein
MKIYKYIIILNIFIIWPCNVNCKTNSDRDEILRLIIQLTRWRDHNPVEAVFTDSIYTLFNNELNTIIERKPSIKVSNIDLDGMMFLMNSYYDDLLDEQRWNYRRAIYFAYLALKSENEYKDSFIKLALASLQSFECKELDDDLQNIWVGLNILKYVLNYQDDNNLKTSILVWLDKNTNKFPIESINLVKSKLEK